MKRRPLIVLTFVLIATAVAITAVITFRRHGVQKPSVTYQGKTAEQWLSEVFTTNQPAAMNAFRAMGTNALPAIVDAFKTDNSPMAKLYAKIYPRLPVFWQRKHPTPPSPQTIWNSANLVLINTRQDSARATLPALKKMLAQKEYPSREYILAGIPQLLTPADADFVPVLLEHINETNRGIRLSALYCLQSIGSSAKTAVPDLVAVLKDPDINVRIETARTLWRIDRHTPLAPPTLRDVVRLGENTTMTRWAAIYLNEIEPTNTTLIPIFIDMLGDQDYNNRLSGAAIVGNYGPAASAAVPALETIVKSDKGYLRQRALDSLKQIDPTTAAKYEANVQNISLTPTNH